MNHQRSSRELRRDNRHYGIDGSENDMVENETEDYAKTSSGVPKKRRTSSDFAGAIRAMDDSQSEFSDRRPCSSSKRRTSSMRGKIPYETKSTVSVARKKSTVGHENLDKERQRRRSRHRRDDESEKSVEYSGDIERHSSKIRRSSISKVSDDGSLRRKKRKRRYGSADKSSSDRGELPIIDILKKAQENRTKYEEPILLPELTTDTIYVQSRNGFSAVKVVKEHAGSLKEFQVPEECDSRPIKVAIITQKAWKCTGFIYQGLLSGMAFMHFILLQTFFEDSVKFVTNYCVLSEIYTNVFSFLITMCVISVFDKFDVAHVDFEHLREIYVNHAKSAVAIFLYVTSFCLHQITFKTNDKLALIHYKSTNVSVDEILKADARMNAIIDDLAIWQKITVSKDILVVLAWFFISLGTQDDMLLANLKDMAKYAEDSNLLS